MKGWCSRHDKKNLALAIGLIGKQSFRLAFRYNANN